METAEQWVSLREFARKRSVSLRAVQKAIESGRVTAVKRADNGRLKKIELHLAMAQWNGNTDLDQAARAGAPLLVELNDPATERGAQNGTASEQSSASDFTAGPGNEAAPLVLSSGPSADGKDPHGYLEARADRERTQAKSAELDYLERVGELVSVSAVREEQFSIFRNLRDNLIAIGARLAPRLAAETDPVRVEHLINEETRKALDELSRALGVAAPGGVGECAPSLQ